MCLRKCIFILCLCWSARPIPTTSWIDFPKGKFIGKRQQRAKAKPVSFHWCRAKWKVDCVMFFNSLSFVYRMCLLVNNLSCFWQTDGGRVCFVNVNIMFYFVCLSTFGLVRETDLCMLVFLHLWCVLVIRSICVQSRWCILGANGCFSLYTCIRNHYFEDDICARKYGSFIELHSYSLCQKNYIA